MLQVFWVSKSRKKREGGVVRARMNRFKEPLDENAAAEVVSASYLDENDRPRWLQDGNLGFDTAFEREIIFLKKGTIILRYGPEVGYYAAPIHTPFTKLALPFKIRSCEYNEYEVIEDNTVQVVEVVKGIVAVQPAWPDEEAGGIQYYFPDARKHVLYYVGRGLRRMEVSEWSPIPAPDMMHK